MRYGDFMYICQACRHTESVWLTTRDHRQSIVVESECRQPICDCHEQHRGATCRTKPCGGALVLTCRDNYGDFTSLDSRQTRLERLVKRQTEQMITMAREQGQMGSDQVRAMVAQEAAIAVREAREIGVIK